MAKKIENEDFIEDSPASSPAAGENDKDIDKPASGKKEKRKVVVINVPKKKKRLRTPSHIIRITLIWLLAIELFLLTYPFLQVTFYITEDLGVTPYQEKAYSKLATQEEIDQATKDLQKALDSLEERPPEESSTDESNSDSSAAAESETEAAQSSAAADQDEGSSSSVRELATVDYNWTSTKLRVFTLMKASLSLT